MSAKQDEILVMKRGLSFFIVFLALCGAACASRKYVCPPEGGDSTLTSVASGASSGEVEIRGRLVWMDQIVHGSFCDDAWSGSVYVTCDVQVAQWEEKPTFLDGCPLTIQEGTVVYVAGHNNEAYYKGCSCHYSEMAVIP